MKSDTIYLSNILNSIKFIEKHTEGFDFSKFNSSVLVQDAVSKRLEEIGENIKKISKETKKDNSLIAWEEYVDTRNFLSHVYQMLNINRLWKIVKEDIPKLKKQIKEIKRK